AIVLALRSARHRIERLEHKLQQVSPQRQLAQQKQRLEFLFSRLHNAQSRQLEQQRQRLKNAAGLLQGVSPLNTLARGYSILLTESGTAVRDAAEVNAGDQLTARLHRGQLVCVVKRSDADNP